MKRLYLLFIICIMAPCAYVKKAENFSLCFSTRLFSFIALAVVFVCGSAKAQIISTAAGTGISGFTGDGGAAVAAEFENPYGIAISGKTMYIGDRWNNRVRKINLTTGSITTFAGGGSSGLGDGGPATAAYISNAYGVGLDSTGNVYVADNGASRIRKIDTFGIIHTVAGNGTYGYSGDGAAATLAEISDPNGLAVDRAGNIYIADATNNVIRKVNTLGIITTFAGTGTAGYTGDGGLATAAKLGRTIDVAVDNKGNVWVGDYGNNVIRKVDTAGIIRTVVGTGAMGYSGDGAAATAAACKWPLGMYIDATGNLFLVDIGNNAIRKVDTLGIIHTIAGTGVSGYNGDGGPATAAELNGPIKTCGDSHGNLYICDELNNTVRKISDTSSVTTGTRQLLPGIGIGLSVTPNPNNGAFTVQGTLSGDVTSKEVKIEVIDMSGKIVYRDAAPVQNGSISKTMKLESNVGNGIYLIRVKNETTCQQMRFLLDR